MRPSEIAGGVGVVCLLLALLTWLLVRGIATDGLSTKGRGVAPRSALNNAATIADALPSFLDIGGTSALSRQR
jgi:hypothetical protein